MGRRILVLSEDHLLLGLVTTNLRKRGYRVTSTSLARVAGHSWAEFGVELLLLNVEPAGRDALDAVRALGEIGCRNDVPVVALCDEMPAMVEFVDLRQVRWLEKPFTVDGLLSTVRLALGEEKGLA